MNTLVILLDGAADEKIPELNGRTPLEALDKRFIDSIATTGDFGTTDGRGYTHLFLLELFTGQPLQTPRGLVEAVGLGVPVEEHQVAYRFSPARISGGKVEWVYRVSREMDRGLQEAMVRNLDVLGDLNPRLYFYEDGRGVMTVDSDRVQDFPNPPAPVNGNGVDMGEFEKFITRTAQELDGLTIMPWGGGTLSGASRPRPIPSAKDMVIISKSPSALGVAGVLNMRRRVVDNMWSGFQEAFRLLKTSDVFMHVEETDDISHRLAPDQKVSLLREVDDLLMENLDRLVGYRVAFVVDHGTSSLTGQHLSMKVPYAAGEAGRTSGRSVRFCEQAERHRPLGGLMDAILDH
jgi:2,3-bisphosphoglycerate-independent phosphoglycerate mutase